MSETRMGFCLAILLSTFTLKLALAQESGPASTAAPEADRTTMAVAKGVDFLKALAAEDPDGWFAPPIRLRKLWGPVCVNTKVLAALWVQINDAGSAYLKSKEAAQGGKKNAGIDRKTEEAHARLLQLNSLMRDFSMLGMNFEKIEDLVNLNDEVALAIQVYGLPQYLFNQTAVDMDANIQASEKYLKTSLESAAAEDFQKAEGGQLPPLDAFFALQPSSQTNTVPWTIVEDAILVNQNDDGSWDRIVLTTGKKKGQNANKGRDTMIPSSHRERIELLPSKSAHKPQPQKAAKGGGREPFDFSQAHVPVSPGDAGGRQSLSLRCAFNPALLGTSYALLSLENTSTATEEPVKATTTP